MQEINYTLVNLLDNIYTTDDSIFDFSKRIFFHHYKDKYQELKLSLFQVSPQKHPKYPNIIVQPHFIRSDGTVIYLQMIYGDNNPRPVSEEMVQLAMDLFQLKDAIIFTIIMNRELDQNMINDNEYQKYYKEIEENKLSYRSEIIDKCYSVPKKKEENKTPILSEYFNKKDWIPASKTRNYALNDTLVDWLDYWYRKNDCRKNGIPSGKDKIIKKDDGCFLNFIMEKGIDFEKEVIELIKQKVGLNNFVTIYKNGDDILECEKRTIIEITRGTPVIYQAVLLNHSGPLEKSYGIPDLLIRSDFISIIISNPLEDETPISKKNIYFIVDIKYCTLRLCSDGRRIRNSGNIPAYKCQLYVYNHALGKILGYEPPKAYLLGRKYQYERNGKIFNENNCFARLGEIQYSDWDKHYIAKTISSIKWIKKLRKKGNKWTLYPKPSISELYPNMSCIQPGKWNSFKNDYAKKIGEITLLWNCGIKNRKIAHQNGIYSFNDSRCNSRSIGIFGSRAKILDQIIDINRKRKFESALDRIKIGDNLNDDLTKILKGKLQISVDFETIGNVFDDLSKLPLIQENQFLFLIGIGYRINDEPVEYRSFVAPELSIEGETRIVEDFYLFLKNLTDKYLGDNEPIPNLFHWGKMEKTFFSNLLKRLEGKTQYGPELLEIPWCDLLEYFHKIPIVINGCFKFGLKEIANRLFELGLINANWSSHHLEHLDGNSVMVLANQIYRISKDIKTDVNQTSIMKEIIEYNKMDCLVIHEIIELLRKKIDVRKKLSTKNEPPKKKRRIL